MVEMNIYQIEDRIKELEVFRDKGNPNNTNIAKYVLFAYRDIFHLKQLISDLEHNNCDSSHYSKRLDELLYLLNIELIDVE